MHKKSLLGRILVGVGITVLTVFNLAPLAWGIISSVHTTDQIISAHSLLELGATADNYVRVIAGGFAVGLRNSAIYAVLAVVGGLGLASLAAFGFDRFAFRGRTTTFLIIIASIPLASGAAALLIPNYIFFTSLHLTNQWFTLPVLYCVYSLPLAVWIVKGTMEGIPKELDEAAYLDGASSFTIFWQVVMPLCKPAIGAAGLLIFVSSWNEFVAGSVMVDAAGLKPVQPLLYAFIGFFGRDWGGLTAAAIIAVLPVVVIYSLFGRLLISGLTRGAVKS